MKLPPITVFLLLLDDSAILSNQPNSEVAPEMDMQSQTQTQPVMITSNETAEDSGYQGKNRLL